MDREAWDDELGPLDDVLTPEAAAPGQAPAAPTPAAAGPSKVLVAQTDVATVTIP